MSENTQVSKTEQVRATVIAKFESAKKEAIELRERATKIIISDDTTLGMANQLLSKVNQLKKAVDEKRSELKKPYLEVGKIIDATAKEILTPLEEGVEIAKAEMKKYNDKMQEQLKAVQAAADKEKMYLEKADASLKAKTLAANGSVEINDLLQSIQTNFAPMSAFVYMASEAAALKQGYIKLLNDKLKTVQDVEEGAISHSEAIQKIKETEVKAEAAQQAAIEQIADKKAEVLSATALNAGKINTRKSWKFEVVDKTQVPMDWLMVDEKKVAATIQANKDKLTDGLVKYGIRFYIEESIVAR